MAKKEISEFDRWIDVLAEQCKTQEDITNIGKTLKKRLIERMMNGEMNHHLGYKKSSQAPKDTENRRNGSYLKTVTIEDGDLKLEVPRDREGSFEPQIIPKGKSRFEGFDKRILSLYARGMSVRDIQSELKEDYDVNVSPDLISAVTEEVMEEVTEWQNRPLDAVYPILFLDCIVVKCRQDKTVINKSVFLALAVTMEGNKELLGMYIAQNEGAKFWLNVVAELKNRGVQDVFIACVDGLKGFPEAINSVFPQTQVQLCIVHQIRNSLKFVPYKDRKEVANDLKLIYGSVSAEDAELELEKFSKKWDKKYPVIAKQWQTSWSNIIPFFEYPPEIRKVIYTTNAIESLNHTLRKTLKTKGVLPNDNAVFKLLYLSILRVSQKWTMPIRNWKSALNQFAIKFAERFPS